MGELAGAREGFWLGPRMESTNQPRFYDFRERCRRPRGRPRSKDMEEEMIELLLADHEDEANLLQQVLELLLDLTGELNEEHRLASRTTAAIAVLLIELQAID